MLYLKMKYNNQFQRRIYFLGERENRPSQIAHAVFRNARSRSKTKRLLGPGRARILEPLLIIRQNWPSYYVRESAASPVIVFFRLSYLHVVLLRWVGRENTQVEVPLALSGSPCTNLS